MELPRNTTNSLGAWDSGFLDFDTVGLPFGDIDHGTLPASQAPEPAGPSTVFGMPSTQVVFQGLDYKRLLSQADISGEHGPMFQAAMPPQQQLPAPEPHSHPTHSGSSEQSDGIAQQGSGSSKGARSKSRTAQPGAAQKRWRQRQKEMFQELEKQVKAKSDELARLTGQNEALRARAMALESLVACREDQLSILARFKYSCSTIGCNTESMDALLMRSGLRGPSCFSGPGNPALDAASMNMYRTMPPEELITRFKGFLLEVSGLLLMPSEPEVQTRINALVQQLGYMMKHLVVLNPMLILHLASLNLETGQRASPPPTHWASVLLSLQLSPQQCTEMMATFELYASLTEKVFEERRLLKESLASLGVSPSSGPAGNGYRMPPGGAQQGSGSGSSLSALSLIGATSSMEMELTDKLLVNINKERSAKLLLCCFLYGRVLTTLQFATLMVKSFPYFPDAHELSRTVALTLQQQQQVEASGGSAPRTMPPNTSVGQKI